MLHRDQIAKTFIFLASLALYSWMLPGHTYEGHNDDANFPRPILVYMENPARTGRGVAVPNGGTAPS